MAANGIPVRLFEAMRPTPELSFAVREYGCRRYQRHRQPIPGVQWLQGLLVRRRPAAPQHAAASPQMEALDVFDDVRTMDYEQARAQGGSSPCWAGRPMTNSSPTCWIRLTTGRPWPR